MSASQTRPLQVTYTASYWEGNHKTPASELTTDERKMAATKMLIRMANAYYSPIGYEFIAPDMTKDRA